MVQGDRRCLPTIEVGDANSCDRVVNKSEAAAVNLNRKVPHSDQSGKTR